MKKTKPRKNNCIIRSIRPSNDEVNLFKKETLVIDPFWNDILEVKQWKKYDR